MADASIRFGTPIAAPSAEQDRLRRAFDVALALMGLPVLALIGALLLVLNAYFNNGPLLYRQRRVGRYGVPFWLYKFRSMRPVDGVRRYDAPLETDRITPLGALLRRAKIDELPQLINVLRGEMSIIGPRPDALEHAKVFATCVPDYRLRHRVRPGITGLAQVELGYAEGIAATTRKVRADLDYIKRKSLRLDATILVRTVWVVLRPQRGLGIDTGFEVPLQDA
ncbi:MAG: sugar transferase [Pseudomonadota bacterium]